MKLTQRFINPMLEKEIRLRMRTVRSPVAIVFYLLAFGVLGLGYLFTVNYRLNVIDPNTSREFFYFLTFTQLALISFMTPGLTAGVISGEREKQTLNILLTTQLSSTTIIISKLVSSLSFMLLIVFATLPIYSVVFLFGGISPLQVVIVFLFFIFMMFVLASFSIMFSTLCKRTMVSVIASYGVLLFIYGFTAFFAVIVEIFTMGGSRSDLSYYIMSTNPVTALYSLLDSDAAQNMFGRSPNLQYWHVFVPLYSVLAVLALWLSIRYLRPVLRKSRSLPLEVVQDDERSGD